jgi:hypothetical protein
MPGGIRVYIGWTTGWEFWVEMDSRQYELLLHGGCEYVERTEVAQEVFYADSDLAKVC